MRKKVSVGITIALMATSAAASISLGYMFATDKFNSRITDFNNRMEMFDKLNEIDQSVRRYYVHAIPEKELQDSICNGYIDGLNDNQIKYYSKEEYEELVNEEVPENTVVTKKYDDKHAIIKVLNFTENTFEQFEAQINNAMTLQKPDHIIIDLRDCKGWNLEQTAKMLNLFTPEGDLIYSIDSNASTELLYTSNNVFYKNMSLAILINEGTSGCAELFTSAMMDYGKASVVGQPTAGNVTENKVIKLSDGSAISIPVKDFVTKSQKIFSGKGINPQKFIAMSDEQRQKYLINSLEPKDDSQIRAAVQILDNSGKTIFDAVKENSVGEKPASSKDESSDVSGSTEVSQAESGVETEAPSESAQDTSTSSESEGHTASYVVSAVEAISTPTSSM